MLINMIFRWFLVIIWAGLIFFLSSQPTLPIPAGFIGEIISKISHFVAFFVLNFLLYYAFLMHHNKKRSLHLAIFLSLVFAILDEFHQSFVPGRTADILDLLTDAGGIFTLGALIVFWK